MDIEPCNESLKSGEGANCLANANVCPDDARFAGFQEFNCTTLVGVEECFIFQDTLPLGAVLRDYP
jgi:hypothetical protein